MAVVVQDGDDVEAVVQFVHWKLTGEPVQLAVSVMLWPTVGVALLVAIEHTGGEVGTADHATVTDAGWLLPLALVATIVYVLLPTDAAESVHVVPVEVHPVHVNEAGLFEHDAVSVMLVPTDGAGLLDVRLHTGTGLLGAPDCQSTVTDAVAPVPDGLMP